MKIGAELDVDILEFMLTQKEGAEYKNYCYLMYPVDNMLEWQAMRDRKFIHNLKYKK